MRDGWYHGLGDVGFWLPNAANGRPDLYWFNRSSGLIIRGGANYSCEQVSEELAVLLAKHFGVSRDDFVLAAVGLRRDSEHEDSCCVTVELKQPAAALAERLCQEFLTLAREQVSKGAKPDYLRLAPVPVNFKGSALVPELQKAFFTGEHPVVTCTANKTRRSKT